MDKTKKLPTMMDVAQLAGVSPMTVSRALKPNTSVSKKTRVRIEEAAEQLGYLLNTNAASFGKSKTGFVAVTIPSVNNANFADTLMGLTAGLGESGLQILLGYTNYSMDEEERLVEQFLQRRPEAMIVTGGSHTQRCRQLMAKAGIPVVEMWDTPATPIDAWVGFSNAQAARLMVDHFHELGFTRIGFIGGDATRDTRGSDRRAGFIQRLAELGLETHRMISAGIPPITVRDGSESIQRLLENWPDTQAVMCVSDLVAFGAISYCSRNSIRVPEDLAIAGFGAYDISEVSNPTITTIDVDAKGIGAAVADLVLKKLFSENPPVDNCFVPKLLPRESTAVQRKTSAV